MLDIAITVPSISLFFINKLKVLSILFNFSAENPILSGLTIFKDTSAELAKTHNKKPRKFIKKDLM